MKPSIEELVRDAGENVASDIHLVAGLRPKFRIYGRLLDAPGHGDRLTHEDCEEYAKELAGEEYEELCSIGEIDKAVTVSGKRLRLNLFSQQGSKSAAIRILNSDIPELSTLGIPPVVGTFSNYQKGLVLVTGEAGSGKSTTLAAILEQINRDRFDHIVTLEDPIEYIYKPDKCVINQREVGEDTASFANGLRAILREDPDVVLIGEMRDLETVDSALSAAETGTLVFATLHTMSAVDSVDRIVSIFAADRQKQIRTELASTLKAVLSQQLVIRENGKGRVPVCEVMIVNDAIRNLIREGKTAQMHSALLSSQEDGSISHDNWLMGLLLRRVISMNTALDNAYDPIEFRKRLMRK